MGRKAGRFGDWGGLAFELGKLDDGLPRNDVVATVWGCEARGVVERLASLGARALKGRLVTCQ